MIWIADFLILSLRLLVRLYIAQHVRKRGAWGPSALCWSSHLAICVHTLACLTQSNSGLFWPALSLLSSSAEESSFSLLPCLMLCSFCLAQLLIPLDFRDHPMKDFQHKFFGWTTLQKVEVDRKKLCESWFVVQFWHPKYWNVPHSSWPLVPDVIFFFFCLLTRSLAGSCCAEAGGPQEALEQALIRCMHFIIQIPQLIKCSWQANFPYPPPVPQPSHVWWLPLYCWAWGCMGQSGLASSITTLGAGSADSVPGAWKCMCVGSHHSHLNFSNWQAQFWIIWTAVVFYYN